MDDTETSSGSGSVSGSGNDDDGSALWNREEQFKGGNMYKYWRARYRLFRKYDEGILLTKELWFSVTPDDIAQFMAKVTGSCFSGRVLDLFCGGGGNTIQLLNFFDRVYGLDSNKAHLQCTLNNATVYHDPVYITEHLKLLECEWGTRDPEKKIAEQQTRQYLEDEQIDVVFGSPPWGGPAYTKSESYNVETELEPLGLQALLESILPITDRIILFLPRNSDVCQILDATEAVFGDRRVRIFRVSTHGHPKGLLCCWGNEFYELDLDSLR